MPFRAAWRGRWGPLAGPRLGGFGLGLAGPLSGASAGAVLGLFGLGLFRPFFGLIFGAVFSGRFTLFLLAVFDSLLGCPFAHFWARFCVPIFQQSARRSLMKLCSLLNGFSPVNKSVKKLLIKSYSQVIHTVIHRLFTTVSLVVGGLIYADFSADFGIHLSKIFCACLSASKG